MNQSAFGFESLHKETRKEIFLDEMERVVSWDDLVALIAPHARGAHQAFGGRPPFAAEIMLRIHCLQLWWNLNDLAVEEELHERPLYRRFARLEGITRLPDESTILRFRHLLQKHQLAPRALALINASLTLLELMLKAGTVVDACIIVAPSSAKNSTGTRDPEMHQTKKGNQWHFGMKAHIGVDADSGLVHTVTTTPANEHDITQAHALSHGQEQAVFADSGYRGVEKRDGVQDRHPDTCWHIAMMAGQRRALDKSRAIDVLIDQLETVKARIRAKVEHPFRVIKCQFGHRKVRYRGLAKNTSQLPVMFALSNLWMVRKRILQGAQA